MKVGTAQPLAADGTNNSKRKKNQQQQQEGDRVWAFAASLFGKRKRRRKTNEESRLSTQYGSLLTVYYAMHGAWALLVIVRTNTQRTRCTVKCSTGLDCTVVVYESACGAAVPTLLY